MLCNQLSKRFRADQRNVARQHQQQRIGIFQQAPRRLDRIAGAALFRLHRKTRQLTNCVEHRFLNLFRLVTHDDENRLRIQLLCGLHHVRD